MAIEEVDVPDFDSHVAHATRQTDRLVLHGVGTDNPQLFVMDTLKTYFPSTSP